MSNVRRINPGMIQQGGGGDPLLGMVGTIAGGAIGTAVGGPLGGKIGASLGGQLAGTGKIDPAATIASAAGAELMGAATGALTDAITPAADAVSVLDDPLAATQSITEANVADVAPNAIGLGATNQAVANPLQASAAGMTNNTANKLSVAAPLVAPLASADPMKASIIGLAAADPKALAGGMGFGQISKNGGLSSLMKGIFG